MARQTMGNWFLNVTTNITHVAPAYSFGEVWRWNVVAAFARETSKVNASQYIAQPDFKTNAWKFYLLSLNVFAWPYFLLRSLRTYINYAIDKIDSGGTVVLSPKPKRSSPLAIVVKGFFGLIVGTLEFLGYLSAKFVDLITFGVKGTETPKSKSAIEMSTRQVHKDLQLDVPDVHKAKHKIKKEVDLIQIVGKTAVPDQPKKVISGMPFILEGQQSVVTKFFNFIKSRTKVKSEPIIEKAEKTKGIIDPPNTSQIYKDLHAHTPHAHLTKEETKVVKRTIGELSDDEIEFMIKHNDPRKYVDPETYVHIQPKKELLEQYTPKPWWSRLANTFKGKSQLFSSEDKRESEGEGESTPFVEEKKNKM